MIKGSRALAGAPQRSQQRWSASSCISRSGSRSTRCPRRGYVSRFWAVVRNSDPHPCRSRGTDLVGGGGGGGGDRDLSFQDWDADGARRRMLSWASASYGRRGLITPALPTALKSTPHQQADQRRKQNHHEQIVQGDLAQRIFRPPFTRLNQTCATQRIDGAPWRLLMRRQSVHEWSPSEVTQPPSRTII